MTATAQGPRQREHRHRVLKRATILIDISTSEIACTVRNQNAGGAELRLPAGIRAPDEFLLYIAIDRTCYRCAVRWRTDDRIGVEILGTEPKPRWHYG